MTSDATGDVVSAFEHRKRKDLALTSDGHLAHHKHRARAARRRSEGTAQLYGCAGTHLHDFQAGTARESEGWRNWVCSHRHGAMTSLPPGSRVAVDRVGKVGSGYAR